MMGRINKIKRIVNHNRKADQVIILIEEMSELTKELTKSLRGNRENRANIAEELGDVQLMLNQALIIYNIDPKVIDEVMDFKIDRTLKMIDEKEAKEKEEASKKKEKKNDKHK